MDEMVLVQSRVSGKIGGWRVREGRAEVPRAVAELLFQRNWAEPVDAGGGSATTKKKRDTPAGKEE